MSSSVIANAFDIHQHVGRLVGVPGAGRADATVEDDVKLRLLFMDRIGIDQCALMPGHTYSAPRGVADIRALNNALLTYRDKAPSRFPVVAGTLDPRHGAGAVEEVERLSATGIQALSWHHRFQGLPIDHPVMFEIVARMDRCGMTVMTHCYANGDFEAPWRLRRLAETFPHTSFIALDAMTSPENLEQIVGAAEVLPNLYLDLTTSVLGTAGIRRCVNRLGADRLVFGTNYYSMSKPLQAAEAEDLLAAELAQEDVAKVSGGNARRIFGLP